MKNGKNVPKNDNVYQFKAREDSKNDEGRTITLRPGVTKDDIEAIKDLDYSDKISDSIYFLRKTVYDITRYELAQLTGLSEKTIKNYEQLAIDKENEKETEKKKDRYDISALLKIAQAFSSIPTKEGRYQRVTFDHICGLTPFSSLDNEDIHDQLGLDDEAIEALRDNYAFDKQNRDYVMNQYSKGKHPLINVVMFHLYMPVINYFLKSNKLLKLIQCFWRAAFSDENLIATYEDNGVIKPIPKSETFGANVLLSSEYNLMDALPFVIDKDSNKTHQLTQIRDITMKMSETFRENYEKNPEKLLCDLLPEIITEMITEKK